MSKINRMELLAKTNGRCGYCGVELNGKFQIDHIICKDLFFGDVKSKFEVPEFLSHLYEFQVNHFDNLMASCASCNNYKSYHRLDLFSRSCHQLELNFRCCK